MAPIEISTVAVAIPLEIPTRISTRNLTKRDYVLVRVRDHDGVEGFGYTYAGTTAGSSTAHFIDETLAPVARTVDDAGIVQTWEDMYAECLLVGRRGVALRAMSAVDMALWDLAAHRASLPMAVMLGGSTNPLPAYASGGYYRPSDGPWAKAVFREIQSNRSAGFTDHKIKVGGLSVYEDADRVRAAVEAMEGVGRLALDANNAYRSPAEALRALHAFEEAAAETGVWWFEEPLAVDDVVGLRRLWAKAETPIATGEISQARHEFRHLLDEGAMDVLQPDIGVLGGVTEFMRVVRTAETYMVPVAPHWHANAHVHLMAAASSCLTIEHFLLEKDIYNFERLVTPETRLESVAGNVAPPSRPGWGIEFDLATVNAMRTWGEPW